SSVGVLSSSVSLHIPLSARLPVTFRALLIFQLNRHRYEQINSASSLPWSYGNESSSVSKTASAPYSTAEDAHRGTRCCECSLRGGIRKSKPVQSGVQALLRKTPDARCTSIAGVPVIVKSSRW